MSETTHDALKMVIDGFTYYQIAQMFEVDDLRGVMSGITKRIRTVTNDGEFELIFWKKIDATEFHDEFDYIGEIHPRTLEALKIAFNS